MTTEHNSMHRHSFLQKTITYLHFDKEAADYLSEWGNLEIFDISLTHEEINWLSSIDLRRWSLDRERAHRSLEGALTRCPVTLLTLQMLFSEINRIHNKSLKTVSFLLKYYQSSHFRDCIFHNKHLVTSLIQWVLNQLSESETFSNIGLSREQAESLIALDLIAHETSHLPPLLTSDPSGPATIGLGSATLKLPLQGRLGLPTSHRLFSCRVGTLDSYQKLSKEAMTLSQNQGILGLLNQQNEFPLSSKPSDSSEDILLQSTSAGVTLEALSESLAEVMRLAENHITTRRLIEHLKTMGLDDEESRELISEWISSSLICKHSNLQ